MYRTVLSVHVGLVGMGLYTWGTEEQKQRWLVPMASGKKLACYGLTEPNAGSDVASVATTAVRDGGEYVITGQKIFVGSAHGCEAMWTLCRTGPADARHWNRPPRSGHASGT